MMARYKGVIEYYNKNCYFSPMMIRENKEYDIVIKHGPKCDHVMIINNGHVRTSIPYSKGNVDKYWELKD